MSKEMNATLLGYGAATQARIETNRANQAADEDRRRAIYAEAALANVTTDADLERQVAALAKERNIFLASSLNLKEELDRSNASITEWMHSNEAFRRLAKQYGKKLGLSPEQRQADFARHLLDAAEEHPELAKTELGKKFRSCSGGA